MDRGDRLRLVGGTVELDIPMQPSPIADTVALGGPQPTPASMRPTALHNLRRCQNVPIRNYTAGCGDGREAARHVEREDAVHQRRPRGIGLAIALRAARDGANIAIAAKTAEANPKLPGTVFTAAREIERAGGKALPLQVDIRYEEQLAGAAAKAAETFGGIDILVNNASAISLTGTLQTPMKRFDLMFGVNVRGTFAASQALLPYLLKAKNPHILTLSPPLSLDPKWFGNHCAYTMAKYGMSMCVLGMAESSGVWAWR